MSLEPLKALPQEMFGGSNTYELQVFGCPQKDNAENMLGMLDCSDHPSLLDANPDFSGG